jgi:hypothetical protein
LDAREGRDGTIGVLRSTFSCRYHNSRAGDVM